MWGQPNNPFTLNQGSDSRPDVSLFSQMSTSTGGGLFGTQQKDIFQIPNNTFNFQSKNQQRIDETPPTIGQPSIQIPFQAQNQPRIESTPFGQPQMQFSFSAQQRIDETPPTIGQPSIQFPFQVQNQQRIDKPPPPIGQPQTSITLTQVQNFNLFQPVQTSQPLMTQNPTFLTNMPQISIPQSLEPQKKIMIVPEAIVEESKLEIRPLKKYHETEFHTHKSLQISQLKLQDEYQKIIKNLEKSGVEKSNESVEENKNQSEQILQMEKQIEEMKAKYQQQKEYLIFIEYFSSYWESKFKVSAE